jgi:hypothetical protein
MQRRQRRRLLILSLPYLSLEHSTPTLRPLVLVMLMWMRMKVLVLELMKFRGHASEPEAQRRGRPTRPSAGAHFGRRRVWSQRMATAAMATAMRQTHALVRIRQVPFHRARAA